METNETINLSNILSHFQKAATKLKYPKLKLHNPEICLSYAGGRARYPGTITVTNGKGYGNAANHYYGRIDTFGTFIQSPYNSITPEKLKIILEFLKELNSNPLLVALTYAKATGNCMFCGRLITTNESLTVGYGPICAENWGLPWGEIENTILESL